MNKLELNIDSDLISYTTLDIINGDKIKCQTVPLGIIIPYQSSNFESGKYAIREMSEYSVIIGMDILRRVELTWDGHQGKACLKY